MGKSWDMILDLSDVFHSDILCFPAKRDVIIERLRDLGHNYEIPDPMYYHVVGELEVAPDVEAFDVVFERLYNWADEGKRLWIMTR
jgi:hypothetical protein